MAWVKEFDLCPNSSRKPLQCVKSDMSRIALLASIVAQTYLIPINRISLGNIKLCSLMLFILFFIFSKR